MLADGARLAVLGRDEKLSSLPGFRGKPGFDAVRYHDYAPELKLMVVPEENVLGAPHEPFAGKAMVVSLFAKGLYRVCGTRPPASETKGPKQQYELRVKRLDIEQTYQGRLMAYASLVGLAAVFGSKPMVVTLVPLEQGLLPDYGVSLLEAAAAPVDVTPSPPTSPSVPSEVTS